MGLIVYADFVCPDCYLASRRVDALRAAGAHIDWRAIEHDPGAPVTGRRLSQADPERPSGQFVEPIGEMLPGEQLPWQPPSFIPKSEAAVTAYAEAYDSPVADDVRRLLFDLYWRRGADIGNPNVLRTPLAGPFLRAGSSHDPIRQQGFAVSVDRGPITTVAHVRLRSWRREWNDLGSPALPVVLVDGATLTGRDAVRRLGKEIVYAGADLDPSLADPRRFPERSVRPHPGFVSQIGGTWRFTYRTPHTLPESR